MPIDRIIGLPFREFGKLLIGGVLNLFPIINLFSVGYILECFGNGAKSYEKMPEWDNWGDKFVNGLLILIAGIIYFLIPCFFLLSSVMGMLSWHSLMWYRFMQYNTLFIVIGILSFLVLCFIWQMALANFSVKRKIGAFFEFGYIFKLIGANFGSYIGAYFLFILALIITMLIVMIPFIGWLFAIIAGFYVGCIGGFLFGSVYGKAADLLIGSCDAKDYSVSIAGGPATFLPQMTASTSAQGGAIYCTSGEYEGNTIDLSQNGFIIGRDPDQANLILSSEKVSRKHAHVYSDLRDSSCIIVEDLGSRMVHTHKEEAA